MATIGRIVAHFRITGDENNNRRWRICGLIYVLIGELEW